MAEIEDETAHRSQPVTYLPHPVGEIRPARDQTAGIEIALNRDMRPETGGDRLHAPGRVDADRIDTGIPDEMLL